LSTFLAEYHKDSNGQWHEFHQSLKTGRTRPQEPQKTPSSYHNPTTIGMPPATSKSTEPSEADIIFNRASVALARSQRLISSWLPASTSSRPTNGKTEEELAQEEAELFTPVPEL